MSKNSLKLKVAYLYPDFLRGLCDKANLDIFKIRAQERDIDVEIEEIKNDSKINSSKYDFYYISGSNIDALDICNNNLKNNLAQLQMATQSNIPILAINCGYILLGKTYQLNNTPLAKALGILNVTTSIAQEATCYKIQGQCDLLNDKIVGYVNKQTKTKLQKGAIPFLSLKNHQTEGCIYKNIIATYITSPILAHNPHLCDHIISQSLLVKYKCHIPLAKLTDDIEWYSHNYILEAK